MIIGIDFDNTIVCYDLFFQKIALEQKLIPESFSWSTPKSIRDYLRQEGREDDWTRLQGYVYGEGLQQAPAHSGAIETIRQLVYKNQVYIISHRTKTPYLGPSYDLHKAAFNWLKKQGITGLIKPENIFFELTKSDKISRIISTNCQLFIDDLPEFLMDKSLPLKLQKVFFLPNESNNGKYDNLMIVRSWSEIPLLTEGSH